MPCGVDLTCDRRHVLALDHLVLLDADVLHVAGQLLEGGGAERAVRGRPGWNRRRLPAPVGVQPGLAAADDAPASPCRRRSARRTRASRTTRRPSTSRPRSSSDLFIPSAATPRLPSKVDELSFACAASACCSSSWARRPSSELQPASSATAARTVTSRTIMSPASALRGDCSIPHLVGSAGGRRADADRAGGDAVRGDARAGVARRLARRGARPDRLGGAADDGRRTAPRRRPDGAGGHDRRLLRLPEPARRLDARPRRSSRRRTSSPRSGSGVSRHARARSTAAAARSSSRRTSTTRPASTSPASPRRRLCCDRERGDSSSDRRRPVGVLVLR